MISGISKPRACPAKTATRHSTLSSSSLSPELTSQKNEMMGAFLDRWNVPHEKGSIESDDYKVPSADDVRAAVKELSSYDPADVKLYLATAGLLMADEWRDSTWPVVDEMKV